MLQWYGDFVDELEHRDAGKVVMMGDDAWTIHPDLVLTQEDALNIIAERRGLSLAPPR